MARSKQTSNKREKEKDKQKKRKEKENRKQARKKQSTKGLGPDAITLETLVTESIIQTRPDPAATGALDKIDDTKIGKIVYLNPQKNYGFIRDARVKENLFFSTSDLPGEVKLNDLVTFTRIKSTRGSTATAIKKI